MTDHRFAAHRVYCPSLGYTRACGKLFRTELEAERFVLDLRRAGHLAWCEVAR